MAGTDLWKRSPALDEALALVQNGDRERGTALFLTIDWQSPGLTASDSIFTISEESFLSLSRSRRNEIIQQVIDINDPIRQLARQVAAEAKQEPDTSKAMSMLKQIDGLGEWLQAPERLRGIQQLGKAMKMMAAREIEQLSRE